MERACLAGFTLAIGFVVLSGCVAPADVPVASMPVVAAPPAAPVSIAMLAAEYRLAQRFEQGENVPQNFEAAVFWYHHAAERGYAPAQLALAQCYGQGRGVPQDRVLAYMWANLAASRIAPETAAGAFARKYRDYTRFVLSTPDEAKAQQMAIAWRPIGIAAP
jgi:TPR repeat protein